MVNSTVPWGERLIIRRTMRDFGIFKCKDIVEATGLAVFNVKGIILRMSRQGNIVKIHYDDQGNTWKYVGDSCDNRRIGIRVEKI